VETSLIRQDLYRRDFTMNALAVVLGGARHGELVDYFGGRKDIRRKEIRVLHSLSFIDDPTRAIRAVRYARRLRFKVAPDTRHLITTAISEGVFERLSGQRLRRELELLLAEPHCAQSMLLLAELGLITAILPDLVWHEGVRSFLAEVEGQVAWYELEGLGDRPEPWLLYLGGLVLHAGPDTGSRLAARLKLSGEQRQRLVGLREAALRLRESTSSSYSRSVRVRRVEEHGAEAMLLAMAGLRLEQRRILADAVEAAARLHTGVRGRDLVAAGVVPGRHLGVALKQARDALIDGRINADEAFDHALAIARRAQAEGHG
jgi:tRNA nucleotidyltransferase (CCA-adding enzyme)